MNKEYENVQPQQIPRYGLHLAIIAMFKRGILTHENMQDIEDIANAAIYALHNGLVVSVTDDGKLKIDEPVTVAETTASDSTLTIGDDE